MLDDWSNRTIQEMDFLAKRDHESFTGGYNSGYNTAIRYLQTALETLELRNKLMKPKISREELKNLLSDAAREDERRERGNPSVRGGIT